MLSDLTLFSADGPQQQGEDISCLCHDISLNCLPSHGLALHLQAVRSEADRVLGQGLLSGALLLKNEGSSQRDALLGEGNLQNKLQIDVRVPLPLGVPVHRLHVQQGQVYRQPAAAVQWPHGREQDEILLQSR